MPSRLGITRALAICALLAAAPVAHAAGTVPFDSAAQLTQFSLNGNASTAFKYNSTGGVSGGGGVTSTSTAFTTDAAIYRTGSTTVVGGSLFASIDYRMQYQSTGPDIRIGFTTTAGGTFDGPNDVWIETSGGAGGKFVSENVQGTSSDLDVVTMTAGDWFRLRLDLTKSATSGFNATASVFGLGSNGLATPFTITSKTFTLPASSLGISPQLFPGFYLYAPTTAADNFSASSVVPEPHCVFLLALGLTIASLLRPRRKFSDSVGVSAIGMPLFRALASQD